jgi:signal transduction histidine kinase
MKSATLPENEEQRLNTLRKYEILDTASEREFDDLTTIASVICGTSIALVSLVDKNRQWFKSKHGLDAKETHRDIAFCSHAILQEEVFVVEDATKDMRFFDNPLVTEDPNIGFYAGVPIKAYNGDALGTLCVIDQKPMLLAPDKKEALEALARQVEALFELRRKNTLVITKQQEIAEKNVQLESSNKHKTRFLNHVSHEIRTPLNAIIGFSQILSERTPVSENTSEDSDAQLIRHIKIATEGLADIVNHVLDFSRIQAGKMTKQPKHIQTSDMLDEVALINNKRAQEKDVILSYSLASDVPEVVLIDKVKLIQILVNLIGNAVKFTPADRTVKIEVSMFDEQLLFKVIDEGVGISDEQQKLIFEPFQQLENKHGDNYVGSGLGLTICKELTEFLGGKVWLDSKLGKGTTFFLQLPFENGDPSYIEQKRKPINIDLSNHKVLLVEDNLVNQLVIKTYLKSSEVNLDIVDTAKSALDYLLVDTPDLVLLDLGLPDMTGLEMLDILRNKYKSDTPVIIVSGDVTEESLSQSKVLGVTSFLQKPVRQSELLQELETFFT